MKRKLLITSILCLTLLTGCGTKFNVTSEQIKTYAENHSGGYGDITDQYVDIPDITGVYISEVDGVHVEMWQFVSTDNAAQWFNSNIEDTKAISSSNAGSYTSTGGDYRFSKKDGDFCRILFSDNIGIYAYGSKENVNNVLR